jgi:hypothetical protein
MNYTQWFATQPAPKGIVTVNGGPIGSEYYGAFVSNKVAGEIDDSLAADGIAFTRTPLQTVAPGPGETKIAPQWTIDGVDYLANQLLSQMWALKAPGGTGMWVSSSPLTFKPDPLPVVQTVVVPPASAADNLIRPNLAVGDSGQFWNSDRERLKRVESLLEKLTGQG